MARPPRPPLLGGGIGRGDVGGGGGRFSGGGIVGRNAVLDLVEGGHRAGVVMLIGLEVQMTEKALLVDVSIWEPILFHGSARSRTVCPYLLQKQSILQQEAAVHN